VGEWGHPLSEFGNGLKWNESVLALHTTRKAHPADFTRGCTRQHLVSWGWRGWQGIQEKVPYPNLIPRKLPCDRKMIYYDKCFRAILLKIKYKDYCIEERIKSALAPVLDNENISNHNVITFKC
jgi:hypothetical protein